MTSRCALLTLAALLLASPASSATPAAPSQGPEAHEVTFLLVEPIKGPFPVAPTRDAIFDHSKIGNGYAQLGPVGPYYPERAARMGISGYGLIKCTLAADGALSACVAAGDNPPGQNFVDAALKLAERGAIAAQPRIVDGQPVSSELVLVLVPFQLPR